MANTRKSAKRALQARKRQDRNTIVRSLTRTAIKRAVVALKTQDAGAAKEAYRAAIRAISKAASKGSIPTNRASRKIARLTKLVKNSLPAALTFSAGKSK